MLTADSLRDRLLDRLDTAATRWQFRTRAEALPIEELVRNSKATAWLTALAVFDLRTLRHLAWLDKEERRFRRQLRHLEGTTQIWALMEGMSDEDEDVVDDE